MPAIYTHYCFGEEMKKVYPPHLQKIIQEHLCQITIQAIQMKAV